jgi:hypothetical protein
MWAAAISCNYRKSFGLLAGKRSGDFPGGLPQAIEAK